MAETKTERNNHIRDLVARGVTPSEVARLFKISRERVRQIAGNIGKRGPKGKK